MSKDPKFDYSEIYKFWEARASSFMSKDTVNLSNLEPDAEMAKVKHALESRVITDYLAAQEQDHLLDLGAGHGAWASEFSSVVASVTCVEYSKNMVELAKENFRNQNITNVEIHHCPVQDFKPNRKFDKVLISGLLIYLTDKDIVEVLKTIGNSIDSGATVVLRDGTGREATHSITGKYSEALGAAYSAYYRTAAEYIELFDLCGFDYLRSQNMFEDGSPFNKWVETVLRVYEFRKR